MTTPSRTPTSICSTSTGTIGTGACGCPPACLAGLTQRAMPEVRAIISPTRPVLCRVYRQMKVPWQITLTGVVLLCSVIHYVTKQQMYENVSSPPSVPNPTLAGRIADPAVGRLVSLLRAHAPRGQAMKQIRRSAKYRTRLKEVLAEQQASPAKPLAKGQQAGQPRAEVGAWSCHPVWPHGC